MRYVSQVLAQYFEKMSLLKLILQVLNIVSLHNFQYYFQQILKDSAVLFGIIKS